MVFDCQRIRYRNKYYAVVDINYKGSKIPIVLDWQDFKVINGLNRQWKSNKLGFASCNHEYNGEVKEVCMHEIVMALKQEDNNESIINRPIIHINRVGLDNRRENLIYDTPDKDVNKNIKKKKRTITLPKNSGIKPEEIPTFVWFMKPDPTHGERFVVEIAGINYKTTSSRNISLKEKLEEAKQFLRQLKKENPDLFLDYSMNGDYNSYGIELLDSFYDIIYKAGFDNIERIYDNNNTEKLLKPRK